MMKQTLLFSLLAAAPLLAQVTTTCTPVGRDVVCTQSKPAPSIADGLAGIVQGMAADRAANAAKASDDAVVKLFSDRAIMVLAQGRDSIAFSAADHAAKLDSLYWDEGSRTVALLYTANSQATTTQMREAIEPLVDKYRRLKRRPFP